MSKVILEAKQISKAFPGVQALLNVNLEVRQGEVHAIVGENGAGKSTLIKILTGANIKDSGTYTINGEEINLKSVHHSMELGISCIYQELTIVPLLDVAKNIFLGNMPLKSGKVIDYEKLYKEAQNILDKLELNISPRTLAQNISVAQQQMLEIGRAISRNAKIIIMDEPTSSLTEKETKVLFKVIKTLSKQDISILYISHKLEEVMEIADRITVLRDGKKIITMNKSETNKDQIVEYMIGRTLNNYFNKVEAAKGPTMLEVKGLTSGEVFQDISFEVRSGEILGFFGLVGAGRSEIMRAIFGVDKYDAGEIYIEGERVKFNSPMAAIKKGICLLPEDRKQEGLVLMMDVLSNSTLVKINETSKFGVIDKKADFEYAQKYVDSLQIKTPTLKKITNDLSGGNQQKVVIAKWLMMNPRILIMDEPTRGIDVATKSEIYKLMSDLAGKEVAIIMVSSELPEILGVCDRIITVANGKITGDIITAETDSSKVMMSALGGIK